MLQYPLKIHSTISPRQSVCIVCECECVLLLPKLVIFSQRFIVSRFVWHRCGGTAQAWRNHFLMRKKWHSAMVVESTLDGTWSEQIGYSPTWAFGCIGSNESHISNKTCKTDRPWMRNDFSNTSTGANQWVYSIDLPWIDFKMIDLSMRNKTASSFAWCSCRFLLFPQNIIKNIRYC